MSKPGSHSKIYVHPLPILFDPFRRLHCEGVFDKLTKSVWVTNREHAMSLWRHGFFGKGDLSRSEPTWLARQQKRTSSLLASSFMF